MKAALAIILLTCTSSVYGQASLEITGKVIDSKTNEPLSYVTISLRDKPIGTLSNEDGTFIFIVPQQAYSDTIQFSMLGYTSEEIRVTDLLKTELVISLKEHPIMLDGVTVSANQLSANEIVKKAFSAIENNFSQRPYVLKCFFRQINTENNKNVFLIESAVDIYDKKYRLNQRFNLQEQVTINQVRSSKNYFSHQQQNYFDYSNTLQQLLVWNFIRYKNLYIMKRTNFVLDTTLAINDRIIYVISSTSSKFTGTTLEGTNRFTLYIDSEDFSFIKIKNETKAQPGYYLPMPPVPIKGDDSKQLKFTVASHTYAFRSYLGVMYLEKASSLMRGHIIETATNTIDREITNEELLTVNEIVTAPTQPSVKKTMDKGKTLNAHPTVYDPTFWNDNQVKLVPLTRKQITDLEWEMSLEKQFITPAQSK
jgi:hypothetical protein